MFLLSHAGFWRQVGKVTDFHLSCLSPWRAGGVRGWLPPRRGIAPGQGGCGLPSGCVSALPRSAESSGSGTAALLTALRLCCNLPRRLGKTSGAGCDASRWAGV